MGQLLHTLRAVMWSFVGLRQASAYERDVEKLKPLHVILAGILLALGFVLALLGLVSWIVG